MYTYNHTSNLSRARPSTSWTVNVYAYIKQRTSSARVIFPLPQRGLARVLHEHIEHNDSPGSTGCMRGPSSALPPTMLPLSLSVTLPLLLEVAITAYEGSPLHLLPRALASLQQPSPRCTTLSYILYNMDITTAAMSK